MRKLLLIIFLSIIAVSRIFSQTTATDFNGNDCNGNPHHFFAEMDAGLIIVMSMVEPCGSCVSPSVSAYNIVKNYATSNPGRVVFYLSDDVGNTPCNTLQSWGSTYGLGSVPTFSSTLLTQNNYGGTAMPKILVLGSKSHTVFFKQDNGLNNANLTAAINTALATVGIAEVAQSNFQITVFPNPVSDKCSLNYFLAQSNDVRIELFNMLGSKVNTLISEKQNAGKHEQLLNFETISNGIYFIKLSSGEYSKIVKLTVSH